jgi:hypothetical protein
VQNKLNQSTLDDLGQQQAAVLLPHTTENSNAASAIRLLEGEPNQNMSRSAPASPIISPPDASCSTVIPSKRYHSHCSHSWNFPSLDHYLYRNKRPRPNPSSSTWSSQSFHNALSPTSHEPLPENPFHDDPRLCLNQRSHATEEIEYGKEAGEAKLDPLSTSLPQISKTPSLIIRMDSEEHWQRNWQDKSFPTTAQAASAETIQREQVAHQRPLSSLPPRPHTLFAAPKTPSPGVERTLDSQHHDRPYGCERHYRDSQGSCVDGVLRR